MNESKPYNSFSMNTVCRVCLITTNNLSEMQDEHKELFKSVVGEVALEEYNMKSCTICEWMFLKFCKFKQQCESANNMLKEVVCMDSKSVCFLQNLTRSYNLTTTAIDLYNYIPLKVTKDIRKRNSHGKYSKNYPESRSTISDHSNHSIDTMTNDIYKNEVINNDTYNNEAINNDTYNNEAINNDTYNNEAINNDTYNNEAINNDTYNNEAINNDTYNNEAINNDTIKNEVITNDTIKNEAYTQEYDAVIENDEDEIPLLMLSKKTSSVRMICELSNDSDANDTYMNEDLTNDTQKNETYGDDTIDSDTLIKNETYDNDTLIDDKVPRQLLQHTAKSKRKHRKIKHMHSQREELKEAKEEEKGKEGKEGQTKHDEEGPRRKKVAVRSKQKVKALRAGFTSRMVQETDEYIVIKLTKEQVLEEMEERVKSESYLRSPYRCEKCAKGFNFKDVLESHLEKHSVKNGSFECTMCGQYCRSAVSLRGHIKSHTTRYKCKLCGHVRLSRQHLLEHHAITHTSAPLSYKCDYCNFNTNKRTVMQRHVRRHASGEGHTCHLCGKLFKSVESLRLHTVRHDKSSRFKCDRCDMSFVYHSLLSKHISCVHERREYYCVECDVQFKSAESLRLHFKKAKRHRDSTAYKHICPECPSRFPAAASLAVHMSASHNAPKPHSCPHCRRLYSTRDALRAHTWRVHAQKEARASCHHCGATFARKSTLKIHMGTHTGERTHMCECGAMFAQDSTLQNHIQAKHQKGEVQDYKQKVEL